MAGRSGGGPTRGRLIALLLVVALFTGISAPTASAAAELPPCRVADTLTKYRKLTDWHRSLVDLTYRLASTYKPTDLRSTSYAGLNGGHSVRRFVIADLKSMASAARRAGARFSVQSAYRSYSTQKSTFAYWVRVDGYAKAIKESARAGHSEHQLGTTLDFRSYGGRAPWDYADWATTRAGKWLKANAWRYGFIMTLPKGKTSVTCYAYEPWHYRYVGRDRAAKIRASGLTLREYLWSRQNPTPTPTPTPTPEPTPDATPTPAPEPTPTP
jgi:zinc D-Ala-D-Ala carboxypeptidase